MKILAYRGGENRERRTAASISSLEPSAIRSEIPGPTATKNEPIQSVYSSNNRNGSLRYSLIEFVKRAESAPSTTRWSTESESGNDRFPVPRIRLRLLANRMRWRVPSRAA